ncbi:SAM-dependent methyltransferase [Fontibacillus solani]|uniref:SAM-dependent methyltransferase n=1 Tax=Fontibacillus solani TaxID=1572857 RepID=A0A7W3SXR7_9BACL|nr:class I SAM-dependent methyltransferase [Fontibacillus solani]MBA9087893.1 SAM-dependent methyltransferase [Fontibacillus solani]
MSNLSTYWNDRFSNEGMIWGEAPSKTAYHALELFQNSKHTIRTVLVPGSGYGRNTKALSSFFRVDGIELSTDAISMAIKWDPKSQFIQGSVLEQLAGDKKYDAIYCYDVLHLFLQEDRQRLIHNCIQQLNEEGLMYFTCFSDEDRNNGVGGKLEEGTFEYVEGKYAHFFTEEDLIEHFEGLQVIETGTTCETLTYNDNRSKEYILRYIVVKR